MLRLEFSNGKLARLLFAVHVSPANVISVLLLLVLSNDELVFSSITSIRSVRQKTHRPRGAAPA